MAKDQASAKMVLPAARTKLTYGKDREQLLAPNFEATYLECPDSKSFGGWHHEFIDGRATGHWYELFLATEDLLPFVWLTFSQTPVNWPHCVKMASREPTCGFNWTKPVQKGCYFWARVR